VPGETTGACVDFCGEQFRVPTSEPLTIGREGDIAIDDNLYLHRRLLELSFRGGLLWLSNVGSATSVTISDGEGLAQSWLSPGGSIPLVFPKTVLWFTAGPTTYELEVFLADAPFLPNIEQQSAGGETTSGRVSFTTSQRLLIVALAEDVLRRGIRSSGSVPPSAVAAERLGWTTTKFNRKLDNVCEKLSRLGVRGLVSDGDRAASGRRVRLVEYALASRLVTQDDLQWLDALSEQSESAVG
jgi:hypothetical protein